MAAFRASVIPLAVAPSIQREHFGRISVKRCMQLKLVIVPLTAFMCVVVASRPASGAAAKAAANRLYVHGMKQGSFYARCIPSAKFSSAGITEVYRVGMEKDERVARYDWYSRDGLVLGWSPIAGAISVMAKRFEPSESSEKQVELCFYLGENHLKSWTTAELQKLGANADWRKEEDPITRAAAFELLDWEQIENSNEYVFTVRLFDGTPTGKKVAFDVLTGDVYRPHKLTREAAKGIADEVARSKGVKLEDYVLTTGQFDARMKGWQFFYTHKPPGFPGGHFAIQVDDETQAAQFIGGR